MITVQPYYYWKGHYKSYAESLKSNVNIFIDKKFKYRETQILKELNHPCIIKILHHFSKVKVLK